MKRRLAVLAMAIPTPTLAQSFSASESLDRMLRMPGFAENAHPLTLLALWLGAAILCFATPTGLALLCRADRARQHRVRALAATSLVCAASILGFPLAMYYMALAIFEAVGPLVHIRRQDRP